MMDIKKRTKELRDKEKEFRSQFTDEEYIKRLEEALLICEYVAMHEEELPEHIKTDKEKSLHSAINKIYRISHVARLPGCMDVHDKWENEFQSSKKLIE